MTQPGFPDLGSLYNKGLVNGILVWTQPGGPGTPVFPQYPTLYPQRDEGFPRQPFSYQGLYSSPCGHWFNCPEVYEQWDPYNEVRAAFVCCPQCSYILLIVEPATKWFNSFYGLYDTGMVSQNNQIQ